MRTIRCQCCLRMVLLLALLAGGLRMSAVATNTVVFLETMATNAVKPWPGSGCNNPWTVAFSVNNPFEQNLNANYGGGNTNFFIGSKPGDDM